MEKTSKSCSNANNNNNDYTDPEVSIWELLPFLPKDILLVIFAYLVPDEKNATQQQIKDASCLARLNKTNYTLFSPKLTNLGATKLLKHVLYTEIKQVVQMVNSNPKLFFIKADGVDDSNRRIQGSSFQSVVATGDPRLIALAMKVTKESHDLRQSALEQLNEQLPASYNEEEEVKKHDAIFASVVKAIAVDPCTGYKSTLPATMQAIKEFKDYFTPKPTEIIKTGKHFSRLIIKKAADLFNENYDPWSPEQLVVFNCEIYGFLQTILSNRDKRVVKKGIANVVDDNQEVDEKFDLQRYLNPEEGNSSYVLGVNCFINIYGGVVATAGGLAVYDYWRRAIATWENYIKQTDQTLSNLRDSCKAIQFQKN